MYSEISFTLKKSICSFDWMKKFIFSILMLSIGYSLTAQELDVSKKTSPFRKAVGQYYLEAGMHIGQIFSKQASMLTHFSANIVLYKKYHIGVQYERLTNYTAATLFKNDSALNGSYTFMYQSAGVRFCYAFFHNKKYQLQPSVSANWAMIQYSTSEFNIRRWNFFIVEPGITFSYIVHKNVAVGAGLHYRINLGLKNALNNKDLNGLYGSVFLRFGVLN